MTGPEAVAEHLGAVLGAAGGVVLLFIGAVAVVVIAFEAAARWRARG